MNKYDAVCCALVDKGKSRRTAQSIVSTVSSLECRYAPNGCWSFVDDELMKALVQRCDKVARYRLKLALGELFPDALSRWPSLFCSTTIRNTIDLNEDSAIPAGARKIPVDSPTRRLVSRLYNELLSASGSSAPSVLTVRNSLTFLYNFLFGDHKCSMVPTGNTRDDAEALVSFLIERTPLDVQRAYECYRTESPHLKRQTTLANLCTHIRLLNFLFRKVLRARGWTKPLTAASFGIPTASGKKRLHAEVDEGESMGTSASSRFSLRFVEARGPGPKWITSHRDNGDKRHYFTADEVRRVYLACETLFEKLLLTALLTTGMRRKGFARADGKSIVSFNNGRWTVGAKWWTVEKRGYRVSYDISPALTKLIEQWAGSGSSGDQYLIPSFKSQQAPVSGSHIFRVFRSVANRAGVHGRHVHPHTTRHTVAWTLSALGNSIEDIAKFVHHKSAQVTNAVYVNMSREQCLSRMTCPWLSSCTPGASLEDMAWDLAEALASPFLSEDGKTFPSLRPRSDKTSRKKRNVEINKETLDLIQKIKMM